MRQEEDEKEEKRRKDEGVNKHLLDRTGRQKETRDDNVDSAFFVPSRPC